MVLPTIQCREAANSLAVKAAINGISACAPVDSGVAVTLAVCASENTIWLTFINQIKNAFCYLFGIQTTTQTDITTLQTDVTTLQTDVATLQSELPPVHTGTPTITSNDLVAGTGSSITMISGSTDVQGAFIINLGTGPTAAGGNNIANITFGTQFAAPIYPIFTASSSNSGGYIPGCTPATSGPVTNQQMSLWVPAANLATNGHIRISYRIGFTS